MRALLRFLIATIWFLGFLKAKRCTGDSWNLHAPGSRIIQQKTDKKIECTVIEGNILLLEANYTKFDFAGLQNIERITGILLISNLTVPDFSMNSLRVIEGNDADHKSLPECKRNGCSLIVKDNHFTTFSFPKLTEISKGDVVFSNNDNLCYFFSQIPWAQILHSDFRAAGRAYWLDYPISKRQRCPKCPKECGDHCWPNGHCQLANLYCPNTGFTGSPNRCSASQLSEKNNFAIAKTSNEYSCHSECHGGCTGPDASDCYLCKNKLNNITGECVAACPRLYSQNDGFLVKNEYVLYEFENRCLSRCPVNTYVYDSMCLTECPDGYTYKTDQSGNGNGHCEPCKDGHCPKPCFGLNHSKWESQVRAKFASSVANMSDDSFEVSWAHTINSKTITLFENCEVVIGSLHFLVHTFEDTKGHVEKITKHHLKYLKSIKRIMGHLVIEKWPFKNLDAFENLEVVDGFHGKLHERGESALFVSAGHGKTHNNSDTEHSVGFSGLKKISHGNIIIIEIGDACPLKTINWKSIVQKPVPRPNKPYTDGVYYGISSSAKEAKENAECAQFQCHSECTSDGCWSDDASGCVRCKNAVYNGKCKNSCDKELETDGTLLYEENVFDELVEESKRVCKPCSPLCKLGCFGPSPQQCRACNFGWISGEDSSSSSSRGQLECLAEGEACPIDYFMDEETSECKVCSTRCTAQAGCTGDGDFLGLGGCNHCDGLSVESTEEGSLHMCRLRSQDCPEDHFKCELQQNTTCQSLKPDLQNMIETLEPESICFQCSLQFRGCNKCNAEHCQQYKFTKWVLWVVVVVLAIFLGQFIGLTLYKRRLIQKRDRDELEPLALLPPNLQRLLLIKEEALDLQKELGKGAFGVVHRGVWRPDFEGQDVKIEHITVAIKTLNEPKASILEEAMTMAACEHPNLVQLIGICQSDPPNIITEYIPRGDALSYVRRKKENVRPAQLVSWCRQIADGMAYLSETKEGQKLVHRDLAARNVLVKTPHYVKIADFGLAQLVKTKNSEFKEVGGRMPLKWLAVECVKRGIYSTKSDVWSFGVTIWELLTYGKKPYTNVQASKLMMLLESGGRLEQPDNCSTEFYTLMLQCWLIDPAQRPIFTELAEKLAEWEKDPTRYVTPSSFRHASVRTQLTSLGSSIPQDDLYEEPDYLEDAIDEDDPNNYINEMEADSRNSREEGYYQNAMLEQNQSVTPTSRIQNDSWLDPVPIQPSWRQKRYNNINSSLPQTSTSSWESTNNPTPTEPMYANVNDRFEPIHTQNYEKVSNDSEFPKKPAKNDIFKNNSESDKRALITATDMIEETSLS